MFDDPNVVSAGAVIIVIVAVLFVAWKTGWLGAYFGTKIEEGHEAKPSKLANGQISFRLESFNLETVVEEGDPVPGESDDSIPEDCDDGITRVRVVFGLFKPGGGELQLSDVGNTASVKLGTLFTRHVSVEKGEKGYFVQFCMSKLGADSLTHFHLGVPTHVVLNGKTTLSKPIRYSYK